MKNNNYLKITIYIILLFLVGIVLAIIINGSKDKPIDRYETWRSGISPTEYMTIRDFSKNKCGKEYFSPAYKIKNEILYDYNDRKIEEGIFTIMDVTYGECDLELTFITTLSGEFYLLNTYENEEYDDYKLISLGDYRNIISVYTDDNGSYFIEDYAGNKEEITDILNEKIK